MQQLHLPLRLAMPVNQHPAFHMTQSAGSQLHLVSSRRCSLQTADRPYLRLLISRRAAHGLPYHLPCSLPITQPPKMTSNLPSGRRHCRQHLADGNKCWQAWRRLCSPASRLELSTRMLAMCWLSVCNVGQLSCARCLFRLHHASGRRQNTWLQIALLDMRLI
jgi:hypothetical protein